MEWIHVGKMAPPKDRNFLALDTYKGICNCHWCDEDYCFKIEIFSYRNPILQDPITHWMELPEMPKKVE